MRKVLAVIYFLLMCKTATASDKMTEKNKKWLLTQPGVSEIGCNSFEDSTYSFTKRDGFYIKESSFKKPRLFEDSKLVCDLWADMDDREKPTLYVIEEAKIDDVKVKLFQSGGSGTVGREYSDKASWQLGCKTDSMTDEYNCYINQKHIYIVKDKDSYHVIIGSEHFPKTHSFIRIDNEKPIESGDGGIFSVEQSGEIIEALSSGSKVKTRYTKWPYENPVDENIDMKYFDVSKKVLDVIFESHN